LTTGARVPPNILFILDDSGSMAFDAMPASAVTSDWKTRTYVHNTIYYNPAKTYQPWIRANGEPMTGGTSYTAAYGSFNLVGGTTINLGNSSSCRRFNKNYDESNDEFTGTSTSDTRPLVCGGVQTFYVPRSPTGDMSDLSNFYRYQITEGGADIVRAEYGDVTRSNVQVVQIGSQNEATGNLSNSNTSDTLNLASVAANTSLEVTIANMQTGSGNRRFSYYVYSPSGQTVCSGRLNRSSSETCTISPTQAGIYQVYLARYNSENSSYRVSAERFDSNSCENATGGVGWINCSPNTTPTGRSVAAEKINYATWFSYHRTRMKAAKAGASAAFAELGTNVRVGFRTIWQRNGDSTSGNWPRQAVPIPVQYNDGLFDDVTVGGNVYDNRTKWYSRLHNAIGHDGTPLHGALYQAGQYFSSDAATGPYGPQTGADQLACRQNFAILTTDGYWNS